ncbi:pilus assembly protein PilP [Zobellella endophytica]|uniref:Pilus assembly protein PilP n=1 Tax=Zobellella endophytica TaxID=2116700 RepID=A0A2P7R8J2_9GAMM|nr:pilus assembly protein PilP [Zobellella endophytica]PSJ46548.1 pilus assembly protein PilP [Zobellella endophytica]
MRHRLLLLLLLSLTACVEEGDLRQYVAEVKARPAAPPEPLPEMNEYVPEAYRPESDRSPFVEPQPENVRETAATSTDCVQPAFTQPKEPLEQYSLDNLSLRGTLGDSQGLWALIQARDGTTYRVGIKQRMGLNHGEVTGISGNEVVLKEYIPDGKGCWDTRDTKLTLSKAG